jgi:hypothetical protein
MFSFETAGGPRARHLRLSVESNARYRIFTLDPDQGTRVSFRAKISLRGLFCRKYAAKAAHPGLMP